MDIKRKKPLIESWQFGQLMQRPKVDIKMGKLWQPCVLGSDATDLTQDSLLDVYGLQWFECG